MSEPTPGLIKRGKYWHMQKCVRGISIRGTTYQTSLEEAERVLSDRVNEVYNRIDGISPVVLFEDACAKYIFDKRGKKSIQRDRQALGTFNGYLTGMDIRDIHLGSLNGYIADRQVQGIKNNTINRDLASLRQVLNRAARVWRHDNNKPYIDTAPLIEMLPDDSRKPYHMTMKEQKMLENELAAPYARYLLFLVNTGGRCGETLQLKWEWKSQGHAAFIIPPEEHKNGNTRILACNSIAQSVLEAQKGLDDVLVFPLKEQAFRAAFDRARERCGLGHIRRHDCKHTLGFRLRAAGVSESDRQDLLGHKSGNITAHYCSADINFLIEAAEKVVGMKTEPTLRLVGVN